MKRIRVLLFYTIIFLLSLSVPFWVKAKSLEEMRLEIQQKQELITRLETEGRKYREEIEQLQQEQKTLQKEIKIYNTRIQQLQREIGTTEQHIEKTNLEIEALVLEIQDIGALIQNHEGALNELLVQMYEEDYPTALELFLMAQDISQIADALHYQEIIEQELFQTLKQLQFLKEETLTEKAQQEELHIRLAHLKQQLNIQQQAQVQERNQKKEILTVTKNEEAKFSVLLRENEDLLQKVQEEIEALEEALTGLIDPTRLPPKRPGVLKWPLNGPLSQLYGKTRFATRNRVYRFHNGVDISAQIGTPIVSAEAGEVIEVGDTDRFCRRAAYGKWILVKHQNNLVTLYAHLSKIAVDVGQKVDPTTVIGYVGRTGYATGPHLHLTVYDGNTVSVKQSRLCGLLPIGGHLNPLDYL